MMVDGKENGKSHEEIEVLKNEIQILAESNTDIQQQVQQIHFLTNLFYFNERKKINKY
jgi:hypothetical protein